MTNNDILRRMRYTFNFDDSKMIELFGLADLVVSRRKISDWLKKEDDENFQKITDLDLAIFLNGFINNNRGKREGEQPKPETRLNNNIILRKLRIALNLKDFEMLEILELADMEISKHELSAFFRNPDHRQYRDCKDQLLRNFIHGMQMKYRPSHKK